MTEYKRLGDYIREVNVRNRELKVTNLVGLTIDKAFIPSVANVTTRPIKQAYWLSLLHSYTKKNKILLISLCILPANSYLCQ